MYKHYYIQYLIDNQKNADKLNRGPCYFQTEYYAHFIHKNWLDFYIFYTINFTYTIMGLNMYFLENINFNSSNFLIIFRLIFLILNATYLVIPLIL